MTTITKERAAIHEAGHAAMAIISGVPFLKVRIFQNSTGDWIGDCDAFERYGGAVPVEDNERVIAGFLAGTMAERIFGYAPPVEREWTRIWAAIKQLGDGPHQGWEDDLLQAIGIVKASYPYATRKDFSNLLASLLSLGWMHADDLLRANSPAVEAIAEGILRFDSLSLSSEEARAIAAASGLGTPVDPDLERLMHARLQAKSSTMTWRKERREELERQLNPCSGWSDLVAQRVSDKAHQGLGPDPTPIPASISAVSQANSSLLHSGPHQPVRVTK